VAAALLLRLVWWCSWRSDGGHSFRSDLQRSGHSLAIGASVATQTRTQVCMMRSFANDDCVLLMTSQHDVCKPSLYHFLLVAARLGGAYAPAAACAVVCMMCSLATDFAVHVFCFFLNRFCCFRVLCDTSCMPSLPPLPTRCGAALWCVWPTYAACAELYL